MGPYYIQIVESPGMCHRNQADVEYIESEVTMGVEFAIWLAGRVICGAAAWEMVVMQSLDASNFPKCPCHVPWGRHGGLSACLLLLLLVTEIFKVPMFLICFASISVFEAIKIHQFTVYATLLKRWLISSGLGCRWL